MSLFSQLQQNVAAALTALYHQEFSTGDFQINQTKPEFEGDYTVVLFSLLKKTAKSPDSLGNELGNYLIQNHAYLLSGFNIIKGFLNLTISEKYWINFLAKNFTNQDFGKALPNGQKVMVEYSSPNTNKPIHLGHLRNNFLGWSVAEILKNNGYEVIKSSIVNDRGVHICKSMYAWQKFAEGKTPQSENVKGDHFVGEYYVKFDGLQKAQEKELAESEANGDVAHYNDEQQKKFAAINANVENLVAQNDEKNKEKIAKLNDDLKALRRDATPAMKDVKMMLQDWEAGKPEVIELWKKMNGWVYEGFDATYKKTGVDFDKTYYESNTYLLGKDIVKKGLDQGIFFKKPDNSVWIDLTNDGMDEKLVLRKDGTSVYITQDLGLAQQKYDDYKIDTSIYVIADEQNYHMKVLQLICEKFGLPYAKNIKHLSYGMVELPSGKMKSREGTVVDADDIVEEMETIAKQKTEELGKVQDFSPEELNELYETIGLGALKFYLLRVDPKKKMMFNPDESIDFHGFTAPFIQFNHARIRSILRKNSEAATSDIAEPLLPLEKELLVELERFPLNVEQAGDELNPSLLAIYLYNLAKTFSSFYTVHSIANAESADKKTLRLQLAEMTANTLKSGLALLGINAPEKM